MTKTQKLVLRFSTRYYNQHKIPASLEIIRLHFGWLSRTSARKHLVELLKDGHMEQTISGKYIPAKK